MFLLLLKEKEKRNYYNRGPYIKGSGCCCCCCSFSFFFFHLFSLSLSLCRVFVRSPLAFSSQIHTLVWLWRDHMLIHGFVGIRRVVLLVLGFFPFSISTSLIYAFCDLFYVIPSFLIEHFVCVCVCLCVFNRGAFKY